MSDIDSLIRERLDAAAAIDLETDPRGVREKVARRQRRIRRRRRMTALLGVVVVAGVAVGVVRVVDRDPGEDATVEAADTPDRAPDGVEAPPGSGPRFVRAPGWEASQGPTTATAATVSLGPDALAGDPIPWDTVERLDEGDVLLQVQFSAGSESTAFGAHYPTRDLPLSLDDAHPNTAYKGQPGQITAHVNGWNIDVFVFYGDIEPTGASPDRPDPSPEARAAAQYQLSRLVVPAREGPEPNPAPDGPAATGGTQPQYLLPSSVPEGMQPIQALQFGDVPLRDGEVVAYGRADAEDPWAGPVLAAYHSVPEPTAFTVERGGDITIAGHLASIAQDDGGWTVEWPINGGGLAIRGIDVSREQVIAAAEAASAEPAIDPTGLPDGLTELARGPIHAAVPWGGISGYTGSSTGLWVSYGNEAVGTDESTTMLITERSGTAGMVDLFRLAYPQTRPVLIRGQHAVLGQDTEGNLALQWYEPNGLLVTLTAWGLTEDTLRRVAEELRETGSDEIQRLVADHPACPQNGLWTDC